MSSERENSVGAAGALLDTSWMTNNEPAAAGGQQGAKAAARGRGGSKRRTRRRTLSPSIGKHNYMSNVDFNDPMNFPSLPSPAGRGKDSSSGTGGGDDGGEAPQADGADEGSALLLTASRYPSLEDAATTVTPTAAATAAAAGSSVGRDADLPDPTVVAGLFDIEGVAPPPPPGPLPLGLLGALENREIAKESSSATKARREGEEQQRQRPGKQLQHRSTARGRGNRRATFGGADARILLEAENLKPVLPTKPPAAGTVTTGEIRAVAAQQQRSGVASTTATALSDKGEKEERIPPQPPAAKQKSRSRSSRRRSIVMPSEAQPFMDCDLGDGRVESISAAASAAASPADNIGGGGSAPAETAPLPTTTTLVSGEGKQNQGGGGGGGSSRGSMKKTPAEELPLSSVNATTCLARSLAAQRGWKEGDEDTRKSLFRAYYAAAPGSQKARRVAARLFCLTGYTISTTAAEDARVLCEAAGDSMEWGLDETQPRLVSQPVRRETKDQKRELVLRIKPLFELMEKASSEERLKAEVATGVVSRKASPDGYRYEDRETGEPVDPEDYKGPYLEHVRAVRASRIREFAARRMAAAPLLPSPPAFSSCALPDAAGRSTPGGGKTLASPDGTRAPPSVPVSPAVALAVDSPGGEVLPAAPTASPSSAGTEAARVVPAGDLPTEEEVLPQAVGGVEVRGGGDTPSEKADDVATAAGDVVFVVGGVDSPVVFPDEEGAAAETPATVAAGEGEIPGDAAANAAAIEMPTVQEQAVGTTEDELWPRLESETSIDAAVAAAAVAAVLDGEEPDGDGEVGGAEGEDVRAQGGGAGDAPPMSTGGEVETPSSSDASSCPGPPPPSSEREPTSQEKLEEIDAIIATAAVPPVVHVDQASPYLSGVSSPVLAVDGGVVSPIAVSPECADSFEGEERRGDAPLASSGSGQKGKPEAAQASSPRGSGVSPGGGNHVTRDEGHDAAVRSPSSTSPHAAAATAAAEAAGGASPLITVEGQEHEEPLSRSTPAPDDRAQGAARSRASSPFSVFNMAGVSPATFESAITPEQDEEGAEEIAALEERLWAAWDAALLEYQEGVARVRSKHSRQATTPAASAGTGESSTDTAAPPPQSEAAETCGGCEQDTDPALLQSSAATPPVEVATTTPDGPACPESVKVTAAAAAAPVDGMSTPESPLLPLLQVRLEEEEGELFEYSSSWRGAGAGAGAGREGSSSQPRGGKARRISLAKTFSSQKTRKGPRLQGEELPAAGDSTGTAGGAAAEAASKVGAIEKGGGEWAGVLCRLCCRKACDTVLRPCEHSACGVCVEKMRVQAEQSGEALSCPWDRQSVDEICPL